MGIDKFYRKAVFKQMGMGSQGSGIAVTTAYPFGLDLHVKPVSLLIAGDTGLSCGLRMRYEIGLDQTNQISIIAVEGRLRVKKDLADGVHAGIEGYFEASETGTVLSGTSTTQNCGGHFAVELSAAVSVTAGWLTGITVDSSVNSAVSLASCEFAGVRVKKTGSAKDWEYGVHVENSEIGIHIGACTTAINFGTPTGSVFKFIDDGTIVSVTNGSILNDIHGTANAGFIKVIVGASTVRYIAIYAAKT